MKTYRFTLAAQDPDTLPMARLAEYIGHLARLLGEFEHVHFGGLEQGSAVIVQNVDQAAVASVSKRLGLVGHADAPEDIRRATDGINQLLDRDGTRGSLQDSEGEQIIRFPVQPSGTSFGPFRQESALDGELIRVGGKDETVPVHLRDGIVIHVCNATREMAKRLAPRLFIGRIRVRGRGRWKREGDGEWRMLRFDIVDFEVLDETPLGEVVQRLRDVQGSDWKRIADPFAELQRLRHGSSGIR